MTFIQIPPTSFKTLSKDVVSPIFSKNSLATLSGSSMFTSSIQVGTNGKFFYDIYDSNPVTTTGSQIQFSIAYGNIGTSFPGAGTTPIFNAGDIGPVSSATINNYYQLNNLIYGTISSQSFNFGGGINNKDIIIISFNRECFKESLQPSSLLLNYISGSTYSLKDDYTINGYQYIGSTVYYNIISASATTSIPPYYGTVFPDYGLIVLNPTLIDPSLKSTVDTGDSFSGSSAFNNKILSSLNSISLQNLETISSNYINCQANFDDLNYTTNPTFTDSNGNIINQQLINFPQVFPTQIGLYNATNDLLAVAKLSRPISKDFTSGLNVRVVLDF